MKILVCIKQVPDTESNPELSADSLWIKEEKIAFRMNRYDEYALEEALLIKDDKPDTVIDVVTVGPDRCSDVLKKSLEKGADNATLVKSTDYLDDAFHTACLITDFASQRDYDLILAGVMSEDLMQCQVGPMIASLLAIPCAVSVVKLTVENNGVSILADSELEGGIIETVSISMPCLLTIQTGTNQPRYPSLSNVMKARGITPDVIDAGTGMKLNQVMSLSYPPVNLKGVAIEGTSEEKAGKLIDLLHEKGFI